MINRANYHDVKRYLAYLSEVRQNCEKTVQRRWSQIRHLLEWADSKPLPNAPKIRPGFPQYLLAARNKGGNGRLSLSMIKATCGTARRFFAWVRAECPRRYRSVSAAWVETLVHPRLPDSDPVTRKVFGLDMVRSILELEPDTLTEQRDQASAAFLFLSGMRVGAFATMPLQAVDLDRRMVCQWPSLGVHTKNGKAATTYLLDIPDLLAVVREWDSLGRANLPPTALWYAHLTSDGMRFAEPRPPTLTRGRIVARGIGRLCQMAGISYLSPHKLRHGHVVYAMKRAKTVGDLKAVSQNLMHTSIVTTDSVYGVLTGSDTAERIAALTGGDVDGGDPTLAVAVEQIRAILAQLNV